MKNLKAPNLKVSPWSQGKWNDSREEKRRWGWDVGSCRRPCGRAHLAFCSAQAAWDHNAFQRLFPSYCHGWGGRAAASRTFKRTALPTERLDWEVLGSRRRLICMRFSAVTLTLLLSISVKREPLLKVLLNTSLSGWYISFCSLLFHSFSSSL